jgi:ATP-dependent phosphofructokinase / diphosphate-dependent phosphofructokinase
MVGIPKTIDNDINATDFTFGFDSAVVTAMEATDKVHSTAESHHRVMIVEVMGRDVGWIALHAGLASSADVILLPEFPYDANKVVGKIREREMSGRHFSIIVIGEGAKPKGGRKIYYKTQTGLSRLGGIGAYLADQLARRIKNEIRVVTLGHVQRGGSPSNVDRILGMRFGHAACDLIAKRKFGHMVALRGQEIVEVSLDDAIGVQKCIPRDHPLVKMAEDIGTCFGI